MRVCVLIIFQLGGYWDDSQSLGSYYLRTQQVTITHSVLTPQNVCTAASLNKPTLIYELTLKLNPQTHQTHVDQMLAKGLCLPVGSLLIFLHPLMSQNEIQENYFIGVITVIYILLCMRKDSSQKQCTLVAESCCVTVPGMQPMKSLQACFC